MTTLDQKIAEAQAEWDAATNAYSRYPGTEEWQTFLDAKKKVHILKGLLKEDKPPPIASRQKETTSAEKVLAFLKTAAEVTYSDIMIHCNLSKDQVRHALLKLQKDETVEKIKTGVYKIS